MNAFANIRWRILGMMAALVACFSACSSEEETPVVEDATFTVDTTVSYYEGLTLQLGFPDSTEPLASAVVDENGQAVFEVDMTSYAGQSVWFCVPKVAKFFHALTPEECANGMLALPDKDKGSTLQTEGADVQVGGKYYKNDWMVALYMGVNKDGNPNGVPIYWATGNLIATKINAANSGSTEAVFHIATFEESCEEANVNSTAYLGADERLLEESSDAYDAVDAGAQWDLFSFGDASGVMMYFHELDEFVEKSLQADGSTVLYDLSGNPDCDIATAQLGASWRTPTGGYSGYNVQNEFAAFEDNSEEYLTLQPDASEWYVEGIDTKLGFKYEYQIEVDGPHAIPQNTLYFPGTGYRHGATFAAGRGMTGWYWSATADPTCQTPYVPNGTYEGVVNEKTTAFNYGFLKGELKWFPHPRTSGQAIRPVCE